MTPMDFYAIVKAMAQERGLPISQLEDRLGFPKGTIKNWKQSFPSVDRALVFARFFNVSIETLYGFTEKNNKHCARIIGAYEAKPLSQSDTNVIITMLKTMQAEHDS